MELKSITFPGLDETYKTAPGGYGYGEDLVRLGNANDDAAFTAALSEQFALTANKTRQFYFTYGGGAFLGKLWNAGNNYGVLVATSYAEPNVGFRFKQMVRVCTNGTWGAWVDFSPTSFAPTSHNHFVGAITNNGNDANNGTKTGWYLINSVDCKNLPENQYGIMQVYNGTYASQIFYADNGAVWQRTHTSLAGMLQKGWTRVGVGVKLLWENASPTSPFDAQTVSLALSDYSQVLVYFSVYSGSGTYSEETFGVHGLVGNWCMATSNGETGSSPSQRAFQITNTGIKFSLAYYATSIGGSLSWSSNLLIPTKIYGIKGVS